MRKRLKLSKGNTSIDNENIDNKHIEHKLKAYKIGDISLTIATIVLVIICLCSEKQFAPFIVLLMSSRIGTSVYTVIKTFSKKEFGKLVVWCALFVKSAFTCWQFFII